MKKIKFLDLEVPVFVNKRNNQISLTLPRRIVNLPSNKKKIIIKLPIKFLRKIKW
jgi:hypothetical protein